MDDTTLREKVNDVVTNAMADAVDSYGNTGTFSPKLSFDAVESVMQLITAELARADIESRKDSLQSFLTYMERTPQQSPDAFKAVITKRIEDLQAAHQSDTERQEEGKESRDGN